MIYGYQVIYLSRLTSLERGSQFMAIVISWEEIKLQPYYRCKLCNELRLQEDFIIHLDRRHDLSLSILENDGERGFIESLFEVDIGNERL